MKEKRGSRSTVGYGQPPKHSQFKPGQSGNPKGRPPKRKNIKTFLKDLLNEVVSVNRGDKKERLTRLKVMILATMKKATEGDTRAFRNFWQWDERLRAARPKPLRKIECSPERPSSPSYIRYWQLIDEAMAEMDAQEANREAEPKTPK